MSALMLLALCLASAAFYVLASLVLKLGVGVPFLLLLAPVCLALGVAAWFESLALPTARLGVVLVLILAFEVVLTWAISIAIGESYGAREMVGLISILAGIAILYDAEGTQAAR
jgi:hypothetical protein